MDLTAKENKKEARSLISKLIQSSNSLAILKTKTADISKYQFDQNDIIKDFSRIHQDQTVI